MKTILLMGLIVLRSLRSQAQQDYKGLLDSIIHIGHPVQKTPLKFLGLKREDYDDYAYLLQHSYSMLDTAIIGQLITNSSQMDIRRWRPDEMRKTVLVKSEKENISKRRVARHIKFLPPALHSEFREMTAYYDSLPVKQRSFFQYSRPTFSNDKRYAAVRYESIYGFGVLLLHYREGAWHPVGYLVKGGY